MRSGLGGGNELGGAVGGIGDGGMVAPAGTGGGAIVAGGGGGGGRVGPLRLNVGPDSDGILLVGVLVEAASKANRFW